MDKAILCFQAPVMFSATFLTRATANQIWIISRNFKVLCFQGGILYEKYNQNFFTWIKNSQFSTISSDRILSWVYNWIQIFQKHFFQNFYSIIRRKWKFWVPKSEFSISHGCPAGHVRPGREIPGLFPSEVSSDKRHCLSSLYARNQIPVMKKYRKKLMKVS